MRDHDFALLAGSVLRTLILAASLYIPPSVAFGAPVNDSKKIDARVKSLTKSAILIDTHNDIPSFTVDGADIGNSPKNHTDIPRLKQGGVGAIFFSVYVEAKYVEGNHSANRALQMIDTVYHDIIDRYPNDFCSLLAPLILKSAHRQGQRLPL